MLKRKQKWIALVVALFLMATVLPAFGQQDGWSKEPTAAAMIADFALVRPLGIVACVLGTGFFIVSLPFSALGGNTKEVGKKLVKEPAQFTFARPLGMVDY